VLRSPGLGFRVLVPGVCVKVSRFRIKEFLYLEFEPRASGLGFNVLGVRD
jgi:hypothetical protein